MSLSALQLWRPLPGGVEDAQHFYSAPTHSIRDDVGRTRNHQFASPLDAPCPAQGRVAGKQVHGLLDCHHYALRGGMTVAGDDTRLPLPDSPAPASATGLSAAYPARRVRLRPLHLLIVRLTCSSLANSPRSASASPFLISSICHSLTATYSRMACLELLAFETYLASNIAYTIRNFLFRVGSLFILNCA